MELFAEHGQFTRGYITKENDPFPPAVLRKGWAAQAPLPLMALA